MLNRNSLTLSYTLTHFKPQIEKKKKNRLVTSKMSHWKLITVWGKWDSVVGRIAKGLLLFWLLFKSSLTQLDSLPSKPPRKPYMIRTLNLRNLFHICDKFRYFPATKHIPYWKNCVKSSLYKWLSITIGTLICFCHCYFF